MSDSFDSSFYLPLSTNQDSSTCEPDEKQARISQQPEQLQMEDDQNDITKNDLGRDELEYTPLNFHWFYDAYVADKQIWKPFSYKDSALLESAYVKNLNDIQTLREKNEKSDKYIVQIKGGRFEVDLIDLTNRPVYWTEKRLNYVRRCLWFYREETQKDFLPYEEEYSVFLEANWEETIRKKAFHKLIHYSKIPNLAQSEIASNAKEIQNEKLFEKQNSEASNEEIFVFHSENIMHHYTQGGMIDEFGNLNSDAKRPRIVRRGVEEALIIEQDEVDPIDHVCFVVHGIGEGCDLKFRPIVECVDNIRQIGEFLMDSYLKTHIKESQLSGRVEFIPISWYHDLHGESTGIDDRLKPITLPSIPKLRQYSNSTILDVLFYTSPIYCQRIISKVGNELNRLSKLFLDRNPEFKGKISLIGHSLGSVIIFDLLSHQIEKKLNESPLKQSFMSNETLEGFLTKLDLAEYTSMFEKEKITIKSLVLLSESDFTRIGVPLGPRRLIMDELNKKLANEEAEDIDKKIRTSLQSFQADSKGSVDYCGLAGTGQLMIKYPQLNFKIDNFFALGSPIGAFITVRGIEKLGTEFKLPICENFFNIFHPFDPIAYRCEPLIDSQTIKSPVLIPHHKGRKRMHLELKENLTKVSEDLKQRMYGQFRTAWTSITEMAKLPSITSSASTIAATATATSTATTPSNEQITIQSVQMTQTKIVASEQESNDTQPMDTDNLTVNKQDEEDKETKRDIRKLNLGKLNNGRRIDFVLQESPIESFNEYLFALHAHACYWESEDTVLLMLKEIYNLQETNDDEEITLSEQQQQSSWLAQTAAATISSNVQKTFSYFNIGLPPTLSSVLTPSFSNLKGLATSNKSAQK